MVTEIPDDPHPRAVAMARWGSACYGHALFRPGNAVLFGRLTGPTWAFICLAALGALLLSAFGRPVWLSRSFLRGAVDCNLALRWSVRL